MTSGAIRENRPIPFEAPNTAAHADIQPRIAYRNAYLARHANAWQGAYEEKAYDRVADDGWQEKYDNPGPDHTPSVPDAPKPAAAAIPAGNG